MSRRPGRAKRVPRAPLSGTVVCWEFLLFCVKRLKNEKKNDLFLKIFDFQDPLSQINLEEISAAVLSHTINV